MRRAPKADDAAELLRRHYQAVSGLVATGADEPTVGAALDAAEAAGLVRPALMQAVHEGAFDRERRAEVASVLDRCRLLLAAPEGAARRAVQRPPGLRPWPRPDPLVPRSGRAEHTKRLSAWPILSGGIAGAER